MSGGSSLVLAGEQALTLGATSKALALGALGGGGALAYYVGGEGNGILSGLCVSCTLENILRPAGGRRSSRMGSRGSTFPPRGS